MINSPRVCRLDPQPQWTRRPADAKLRTCASFLPRGIQRSTLSLQRKASTCAQRAAIKNKQFIQKFS